MKEATDYGSRRKALKQEQQRLERKQAELLDKRRSEIGRLVEKLGLLAAAKRVLNGAHAAASRQRWKDLGDQAFSQGD